ncbi:MAG: PP2C family protein-serine/threonine phosphatase [Gammaproteobacteria bacterium]|jgi:serine/threonine protein phosphatase PrpC
MDIITRFDATDETAEAIDLNHAEAVCFSTRSPVKATPNEDSLAIIPVDKDTTVLIVADGLGGMAAGEKASKLLVDSIINSLNKDAVSVRESILNGIDNANKELVETNFDTGTTVSIAEIKGNTLRTYHAGDSLILLSAGHAKPKYLAMSHSPISYAVACGAIDAERAMCHPERNLISNYVGCLDMHINIGPTLELSKFDTLILSSDAVSDNLYDDEICEHISKESLSEGTSELIEHCKKNMKEPSADRVCHPDDFTLITYRLK